MKIKYLKNISLALIATLVLACTEDLERADYVAFESKSIDIETPATGSGEAELKVYTTQKTGSDRTFTITVDPSTTAATGTYTVPTTVTVPKNSNVGTFSIQSDASNIGKKIVLIFAADESTLVGSSMTVNIYEECPDNLLYLDIKFDTYSEEFAWEILDSNEDFVAGNEGFGEYPRASYNKGQIRERICLPAGTYTFAAYDAYGDGLDDGSVTGRFDLRRVSDGAILASGEGAFENGEPFEFTLP